MLFRYSKRHVLVASFGDEVRYDPTTGDFTNALERVEFLAREMGAHNVLLQLVANGKQGRSKVVLRNDIGRACESFVTLERDHLDGVILTRPGDAVAFMTRDCPTLILHCAGRREIAILHVSRNSVQGIDAHDPDMSVIRDALGKCLLLWKMPDRSEIQAVVTMGISALPFHNERYLEVVEFLRSRWGEQVAPRDLDLFSPIDLFEVIVAQLKMFGIDRSQVVRDCLDTFSDPRLASKRAKKSDRHNLVIVLDKDKVVPNPRREIL